MLNSNVEIRIAGSSGRPQLLTPTTCVIRVHTPYGTLGAESADNDDDGDDDDLLSGIIPKRVINVFIC